MRCSHDDCQSTPEWHPVLELRSRRGVPATKAVLVQLGYCDAHRETLKLETFLSAEGFARLTKHVREAGKPAPDRSLTTLTWRLLGPELTEKNQQRTLTIEEDLAF